MDIYERATEREEFYRHIAMMKHGQHYRPPALVTGVTRLFLLESGGATRTAAKTGSANRTRASAAD